MSKPRSAKFTAIAYLKFKDEHECADTAARGTLDRTENGMNPQALQKLIDAACQDEALQGALREAERWAAEALATLSRQSTEPFSTAEFLAGAHDRNVPATPAYHAVQLESVLRRSRDRDRQ